MPKTTRKKNIKTQAAKGKKGGAQVMVAATGALVGAAIGGAAAVALSEEKNRKAVATAVTGVSKYAATAIDALNENSDKIKQAKDQVVDTAKETQRAATQGQEKKSSVH